MIGLDGIVALIQGHGLGLLAPIAVLEGPIVSVIAGYLASLGMLHPAAVCIVVILADLVGDALLYGIGRGGGRVLPARARRWFDRDSPRVRQLALHFRDQGGRTLILGKLTHSAGAVVLLAAGVARMPFGAFLWFNLLATVPKSLCFVAIGYVMGHAYVRVENWLFTASTLMMAALLCVAIWSLARKRVTQ